MPKIVCPGCNGARRIPRRHTRGQDPSLPREMVDCPACNGAGEKDAQETCSPEEEFEFPEQEPDTQESAHLVRVRCDKCKREDSEILVRAEEALAEGFSFVCEWCVEIDNDMTRAFQLLTENSKARQASTGRVLLAVYVEGKAHDARELHPAVGSRVGDSAMVAASFFNKAEEEGASCARGFAYVIGEPCPDCGKTEPHKVWTFESDGVVYAPQSPVELIDFRGVKLVEWTAPCGTANNPIKRKRKRGKK